MPKQKLKQTKNDDSKEDEAGNLNAVDDEFNPTLAAMEEEIKTKNTQNNKYSN